jgi:hypothetical protein
MKRHLLAIPVSILTSVACAQLASAQALKDKVIGGWTLVEGSETMPDGKKVVPWGSGQLILGRSGNMSFFVLGKDRKPSGSVRTPVGPMVAYFGTYTVNEAAGTLTYKIEGSSFPGNEGATREQKITFTTTGSPVDTPEGKITPVNVWKKAN